MPVCDLGTQLLQHTALSPLSITICSYNRRVEAVEDLLQLFVFTTAGVNPRVTAEEAEAIANAFKACFFKYLKGVGHVDGTAPSHITWDEHEQQKDNTLFRAKVALRQFTDSWLLPIDGEEGKIKVLFPLPLTVWGES